MDQKVRWSADPLSAEVSGNVVLMSIERGAYFGLDGVGSDIWRRLMEPTSVAGLCDALEAAYRADREALRADVLQFLGQLADEGLIELLEG